MKRRLELTGMESGAILAQAATFCDRLQMNDPGVFSLDRFDVHMGPREVPLAHLVVSTADKDRLAEGSHLTLEEETTDGELWVSYGLTQLPRNCERRNFGNMLRAVGAVCLGSPFPIGRAAGNALVLPEEFEIETTGSLAPEDQERFEAFLRDGGWMHEPQYELQENILSTVTDLATGAKHTYTVQFSRYGQ